MMLVTGATGQYGANVITHLLNQGVDAPRISALVRDTAKGPHLEDRGVELRMGDYADEASLLRAFRGIDTILLVSSNDREAMNNRTAHHKNAIKAAVEAQVKRVVYTSFVRKPEVKGSAIADFQASHVETEQFLKDSGIDYTILQNGIYLEMIPIFAGNVAETGVILLPARDGKASWVLRQELAEAAACVLTTEGHRNKTYRLTNTESVSFNEIAQVLSTVVGKDVQYQSPSVEAFEATMKQVRVPEAYISLFVSWATAQAQGELDVKDDTLASFLGRKPTTTRQFIQQVYSGERT